MHTAQRDIRMSQSRHAWTMCNSIRKGHSDLPPVKALGDAGMGLVSNKCFGGSKQPMLWRYGTTLPPSVDPTPGLLVGHYRTSTARHGAFYEVGANGSTLSIAQPTTKECRRPSTAPVSFPRALATSRDPWHKAPWPPVKLGRTRMFGEEIDVGTIKGSRLRFLDPFDNLKPIQGGVIGDFEQ